MRFLCLGVGDAHSARWYNASVAVECDGSWLLIDCPHPIRKVLREAGEAAGIALDVPDFAGVVLTHLHADHAAGLEGYGFYWHFGLKQPAVLLTHPEVAGDLWEHHLKASMGRLLPAPDASPVARSREDYFDVRLLSEHEPTTLGPFTIECRRTIHHIPTFALRIQGGGRSLGLSADTAFDPGLIDWLDAADLIIHETNVGIHTPYEALAALPERLRAKMRLTHYPDDFDLDASAIEPLQPGRCYEV